MAQLYPIFDIAPNTLESLPVIYFVRYQGSPQGNQIHFGKGIDNQQRFVHEVCGVLGDALGLTPGQNVYENWQNLSIQHDYVANYPSNYLEANPDPLYARNIFE